MNIRWNVTSLLIIGSVLSACEGTAAPIPDGVYQTSASVRRAGDLVIMGFDRDRCFWASCADPLCAGIDKQEGTRAAVEARFVHAVDGPTLWIRARGGGEWTTLAEIDEALCDRTGGLWADDDLPANGLWCDCGADRRWSTAGCRSS